MKYFYERNTEFLESDINKTFDEVLLMTKEQFREWVVDLRKRIVSNWDEKGNPPRVGCNEQEIIDQFRVLKLLLREGLKQVLPLIRKTHDLLLLLVVLYLISFLDLSRGTYYIGSFCIHLFYSILDLL